MPGLLLRALIPVGFMPTFGPGMSVGMSLCDGYGPVAPAAADTTMDMSMGMSMDMPMAGSAQPHSPSAPESTGGAPHSHQDHSCCPYAASATLATQSMWVGVPLTTQRTTEPPLWESQVTRSEIPPRAQSARGPPSKV